MIYNSSCIWILCFMHLIADFHEWLNTKGPGERGIVGLRVSAKVMRSAATFSLAAIGYPPMPALPTWIPTLRMDLDNPSACMLSPSSAHAGAPLCAPVVLLWSDSMPLRGRHRTRRTKAPLLMTPMRTPMRLRFLGECRQCTPRWASMLF